MCLLSESWRMEFNDWVVPRLSLENKVAKHYETMKVYIRSLITAPESFARKYSQTSLPQISS